YFVYRPVGAIDNRFAHYLLRSNEYFQYYASISSGVRLNQWDLDPRAFERLKVAFPPLEEQRQIADYLDRELTEIDDVLVEQKHLRDLLFERRVKAITYATHSSNPELKAAPLVRLRHVASLNPSPRTDISSNSDQTFPLYSMDSISEFGSLRQPVLRPYSELANGYSYLEPTDVAYAKVTPCFENGKGLVGTELDGPSFATTELTVFRPSPELDQNYLALVLQSAAFHAVGKASMTGAGGLKRVSETAARNYRFPLPDKKTQTRIVEKVRFEVDSTDSLISESSRLSDLLTERRAALISEAVTGQIDVSAHGESGPEQFRNNLEANV
uniref:restriction endonuclease subunit S n=1 Tax=Corynebacterium stationis TaxID=1705 RepID=UPI002629C17C